MKAEIGGGVASVHLPNDGYRVIGTTLSTSRAMINLAGLDAQGIPNEVALAALADSNHGLHGVVQGFVNNEGGTLKLFEEDLQRRSNGLGHDLPVTRLPLDILSNLSGRQS